MKHYDEGAEVIDEAIERIEVWGDTQLLAQTFMSKGIALENSGRFEDAIEVYDEVANRFGPLNLPETDNLVAMALVCKGALLAREGKTLSEDEAAELLKSVVEWGELPINTVAVLIQLSAKVGPAQTLELIQASPAEDLLLPLVTALQQELGAAPRVSREIEEVANDIRRDLHELQKHERQLQTAIIP